MRCTYTVNSPAPYGLYFSKRPFSLSFVSSDGELLEGRAQSYRKFPTVMLVGLSPVFGAVFVLGFPVIVLVACCLALVKKFWRPIRSASDWYSQLVVLPWEPAASYLDPFDGVGDAGGESAEISKLKTEVALKRACEDQVVKADTNSD